jgi:hypothetical protein
MKTKNFNKKLVLSKRTVVNLDDSQMDHLRGGIGTRTCTYAGEPTCTCYETYWKENCPTTSNNPLLCVTEIDLCC